MDNSRALNTFLASVEQRAYRMARYATRSNDDACDIVQDAMLRLASRYAHKGADDWPGLFFRILERRIIDWHRRKKLHRALFGILPGYHADPERGFAQQADTNNPSPEDSLANQQLGQRLEQAISALPLRQQQVYLLRELQGFDVRQTAQIMQCSSGSVKTHYSRARERLRAELEDLGASE